MSNFLWFAVGTLFGGIVGVVCDRLYQWYEEQIWLDAVIGYSSNAAGELAVNVTFTNRGRTTIPPCKLQLRGTSNVPDRFGTMVMFRHEQQDGEDAGWVKDQKRVYNCALDFRVGPVGYGIWFQRIHNYRNEEGIRLQLELENSDKILWESLSLGHTMMQILASCHEEQGWPKGGFYPMHSYYDSIGRRLNRLWTKVRRPFRSKPGSPIG